MKNLFLLTFIIPFFFYSCSSDDSINLKKSAVSLKYGEKYQIKASSDSKITYTSENEFHATVSETGLITAGKVGETNILISNENDTKLVKVTVTKSSDLYPDPYIEWSILKEDLIKKLGTPDTEETYRISYNNFSTAAPIITYYFNDKEEMAGLTILIDINYSSELDSHLDERYNFIHTYKEKSRYINGISYKKTTMSINVEKYGPYHKRIIYSPYSYNED